MVERWEECSGRAWIQGKSERREEIYPVDNLRIAHFRGHGGSGIGSAGGPRRTIRPETPGAAGERLVRARCGGPYPSSTGREGKVSEKCEKIGLVFYGKRRYNRV